MGLGQSKQNRFYRDPRYPIDFPQYQQPFIPGYVPVNYAQPVYPQPGFIPPVYGQGIVIPAPHPPPPPQQLHFFPEEPTRRRKTKRPTRADTFVGGFGPRDQSSPPLGTWFIN